MTYADCDIWGLHGYLVYIHKEETQYVPVEFQEV